MTTKVSHTIQSVIETQRPTLILAIRVLELEEILNALKIIGYKAIILDLQRELGDRTIPYNVARVIGDPKGEQILRLVEEWVNRDKNVLVIAPNEFGALYMKFVTPGGYFIDQGFMGETSVEGFERDVERRWFKRLP